MILARAVNFVKTERSKKEGPIIAIYESLRVHEAKLFIASSHALNIVDHDGVFYFLI